MVGALKIGRNETSFLLLVPRKHRGNRGSLRQACLSTAAANESPTTNPLECERSYHSAMSDIFSHWNREEAASDRGRMSQ